METLENIFDMDKASAVKLLAYHEKNKTLLKQIKLYHPKYLVTNTEVAKFLLIKDLGLL